MIEPVIILALFISMVVISFVYFPRAHTATPASEAPSDIEWGILPKLTGAAQTDRRRSN